MFIHTCFRVTQLRINTNNVNTYYYKNTTKVQAILNFAASTYNSEWGECGGVHLIGLCLRASFLTSGVLFYNDNFIIYFKNK